MIFRSELDNLGRLASQVRLKCAGTVVRWHCEITHANHDTKVSIDTIVSLFREMASDVMALVLDLS